MTRSKAPITIDLTGFLKGGVTAETLHARLPDAERARGLMKSDLEKGIMDFVRLPDDKKAISAAVALAKKYKGALSDVIVCGIGGSALGFLALTNALCHPRHNELPAGARKAPRFHVLDNADAETVAGVLDVVNLGKSLVVLISKSGSGGETIGDFLFVFEALVAKHRGDVRKALRQVVIITDPVKGPLRRLADEYGVASLPVPPNVGGRFSVMTPVGTFPAALLGIDAAGLLAGAGAMRDRCRTADPLDDPALVAALLLDEHNNKGRAVTVFMPYSNALWRTADWFRQLWAESLGKAVTRDGAIVRCGMTPMAALGATDQHSQVQLFAEGPDDKTYIFLRTRSRTKVVIPKPPFEKDAYGFLGRHPMDELLNLEGDATEAALSHFGRPTARITMPRTDAHALGQVMMFLELTTACVGALWNINAYDQPGVELGKILTMYGMGKKEMGGKVVDAVSGKTAADLMPAKGEKPAESSTELVFR